MKVSKIICDRCGKEIIGEPTKIYMHKVSDGKQELTEEMLEMLNRDFCDECTEKIMNFAKSDIENMDALILKFNEPTEEEIEAIKKAMKDMPPRVILVEPTDPTVEVVQKMAPVEVAEPAEVAESEPMAAVQMNVPMAAVPETPDKKPKPTVKDLIQQGLSKREVMEITGCKPTSYDTTKHQLKKQGLLPQQQEQPTDPTKIYKCSKVHDKCLYGSGHGPSATCDYMLITGERRGCPIEECNKFKRK